MSAKHVTIPKQGVILSVNKDTVVEFSWKQQEKTKGQKEFTSIKMASNSAKLKATTEKKKSMSSESLPNWGYTFGKQNLLCLKQAQSAKSTKHTENKEIKRHLNTPQQQKNKCSYNDKHTNWPLSKNTFPQRKTEEHLKIKPLSAKPLSPSTNNIPKIPSVIVLDKAVQSPEISDNISRFDEFNPVRTLRFLFKELEDSIEKDKRTTEIFNEIRPVLSRIPEGSPVGKPSFGEENDARLQEDIKMAKAKSRMSEKHKLHNQILKQDTTLKEANQKLADLKDHVKKLTQQLNDVTQVSQTKAETVTTLKQQIENNEKVISDLRTNLAKQTKLARDGQIKIQCMMLEKEKMSTLSFYKDKLFAESRNVIKEFQENIAEQFTNLNEACMNGRNASSAVSPVGTGPICSSPNSSSSDVNSLLDFSLSALERTPQEHTTLKTDSAVMDSARFVSLAHGESSHTILPESYHNQVTDSERFVNLVHGEPLHTIMPGSFHNQVANGAETSAQHHNKNNAMPYRNANASRANAKYRSSHHSPKRSRKKQDAIKAKKYSKSKRKQDSDIITSLSHEPSKTLKSTAFRHSKPIVSDIERQVQSILDEIQNRIPVDTPSPLREYSAPDWSDSILSSSNTASDIVPSNDI